jgi:hypothetical protein
VFGKPIFQTDIDMHVEHPAEETKQRKLTEQNLMIQMEENKAPRDYIEDCEAISSSRETEYSVSNFPNQSQCPTSGYATQRTAATMSSPFSPIEFMQNKFPTDS